MTEAAHPVHSLAANVGSEHQAEPVPPMLHRLVAEVDPAFEEQVVNVPQR